MHAYHVVSSTDHQGTHVEHSWLACRRKSSIVTNTKTMQQATHAHAATDDTANTSIVWYAPEEQRLRPFLL